VKVVVAEDDPVTRRALVGLLAHLGHQSLEACNGLEAWDAIQSPDRPSLVILDWMMPAPSGLEVCRRLRRTANGPYQYVLMLTARDSVDDVVEGMEAGADDYLRKPFDMRELRARVRAGERMLAQQDKLRAQATTDELTGALNRRGIIDRIDHELGVRARHAGPPFALLLLDIDNFKTINDTYGHSVGDEVLKEIAARIQACLRTYDDVARYGGEEFLVVLPACEVDPACGVADRVRRWICDEPVNTSVGFVRVTISIGVAGTAEDAPADRSRLISKADDALYAAKANGRNRVERA
jgi:two-component system cell cycle response regulator